MSNHINIIGTVATDPRLITTQAGVVLCTFRVASGDRRYDRAQQKWVDGETNWFGVTVFRALAEHASLSFRKGQRIIVNGRLRIRRWENQERSGTAIEIEADALGHDLRWGVSRFEKRVGPEQTDQPAELPSAHDESPGSEQTGSEEAAGTADAAVETTEHRVAA